MNKLFLIIACCGLMLSSCKKEDLKEGEPTLNGKWCLETVTSMAGIITYQGFEWTFEVASNTLTVNNTTNTQPVPILDTGVYAITSDSNSVTINSVEYDYFFENGKLILSDHPEVDGPIINFTWCE